MKRRDFIKFTLSSLLVSQLPTRLFAKEPSLVAVSEGQDYAAITRNVLSALGGMKQFVKQGNTVVVKPNMGWDRKPEYAATTHPIVVKTIVEECLKAGARKVKVFDNPCNDPRRSYESSGIPAILKGMENVEVKQMDRERYKNTKINGVFLKEWELYDEALSANVFINVPIAKAPRADKAHPGTQEPDGYYGRKQGLHSQGYGRRAFADVSSRRQRAILPLLTPPEYSCVTGRREAL